MRITSDMNYRMLAGTIQQRQLDIRNYQQQISSGLQVAKPSDDPGAFGMLSNLKTEQSQLKQYVRNADMARKYYASVNQGVTKAVDLLHRVNELTVQAGDATLSDTARAALAEEADSILKSMLSVANGSESGSYTFAGLRTDTVPYETELDAEGRIIAVRYVGSTETRSVKTGESLYVSTNLPGSTAIGEGGVFQTETRDVFDSIIRLRDALLAGESIPESDIPAQLQADLDHLLNSSSINGVRDEQARLHRTYLLEMQTANTKSTEALEAVDLPSALMKLSQAETAYNAAMYSASNMMQRVSLLNFI